VGAVVGESKELIQDDAEDFWLVARRHRRSLETDFQRCTQLRDLGRENR